MKLEETCDKAFCEECGSFRYGFKITIGNKDEYDDTWTKKVTLCKKCLLKLLKEIIER